MSHSAATIAGRIIKCRKPVPSCGREYIKYTGIGTQQVEEQLKLVFPNVRCLRMDMDTTSGKTAHRDILDAFTRREADVLIGTQMVAKGLDIPNVTLCPASCLLIQHFSIRIFAAANVRFSF